MRSPQDMQIVLIDITNAYTERCSNCTRFVAITRSLFSWILRLSKELLTPWKVSLGLLRL